MSDRQEIKSRVGHVLEDPSAQAVARVYADAFLAAAKSIGVDAALEELATFLDNVLAEYPEFETVLVSGLLSRDDKLGLIDRAVAPFGSEFFTNFLRVLARHDRLELLPLILAESRLKHERQMGRRRVQVRSATELSAQALASIQGRLAAALPFEPILETQTDPDLLGGVVIQIGDIVHDGSLRSRMNQLRTRLRERSLHEVQVGRDRFSHPDGD